MTNKATYQQHPNMYGFIVRNWKAKWIRFPCEEAIKFIPSAGIGAVADGVTRDCLNGAVADKSLIGIANTILYYPRQLDPAKIASDIFIERYFERMLIKESKSKRDIYESFEFANKNINKWYLENMLEVDYLANDFPGCVGAGVVARKGDLNFGYIADSGVAILKSNGDLKFKTTDEGPGRYYAERWNDERMKPLKWKDSGARLVTRRDYRNPPENHFSYGVLTGEEAAMNYVRTGCEEYKEDDFILVYTDGISDFAFEKDEDSEKEDVNGEFVDNLKKRDGSLEKLCKKKVRTEGSLVVLRG